MQLPDKRKCIVYRIQPLQEQHGKIILHLVGDDYERLKDDKGKDRILMKSVEQFNEEALMWTLIGYVD